MVIELSPDEKIRYDRQIKIPGWGLETQIKLKKSKVAIVGAGGLGSPNAIYLAAAGIGEIILIDNDVYDLSNLNRQVLASTKDVGRPKAKVGAEKIKNLNPNTTVKHIQAELNEKNISTILKGVDLVIDALDNWVTRFLVNKYCVQNNIILVHGGVMELGGQVLTVVPRKGPCLNCIFKDVKEVEPGFAVLGTTPGIIGTIQALEAIKALTNIGELLTNRILIFDGYRTSFEYV
ncbi:MAG: HesA/MoeB/ThiF family protein, partial [Candidatus Odinarchaeia archaeon]